MANPVQPVPSLPPVKSGTKEEQQAGVKANLLILIDHARRINSALVKDGTEAMGAPLPLASYETADLPDATLYEGAVAYDTDLDQLVYSDGSAWLPVGAGSLTADITSYTSGSGTHTTAAGCSLMIVELWGAGGGSSGSGTGATAGGNGGDTTFSSATASGGTGGQRGDVSGVGGAGGGASGGDINVTGQLGGGGQNATSQPGGFGGGSPFLGIWTQGATPGAVGVAGVANTGAGAGAAGSGVTTPAGGGGGGGGYARLLIVAPGASYSYGVGAGGTAGGAGTSGFAGAVGGSGRIAVTEYIE